MTRSLNFIALAMVAIALGGCVTWNEVLVGVKDNDPNKVRDAARAKNMFDGVLEINKSNVCGSLALHLATTNNNPEIVRILLQEGANPNLPAEVPREPSFCESLGDDRPPPGAPPLHYAILRGVPVIAEELLFFGADPELRDGSGRTALQLARDRDGMEKIVAYIESPLHLAARTGNMEDLTGALASGADTNERMALSGTTPIEEALLQRRWFVVDYLLQHGAGQQTVLSSPDVQLAIGEYLEEQPNSPHAPSLRALMGLPTT